MGWMRRIGWSLCLTGMVLTHLHAAGRNPSEGNAKVVLEMCRKISTKLTSINLQECLGSHLTPSDGRSVDGLPVLIREFPPLPGRTPRGRILVLGGIHGDEYSSVSLVFKWIKTLDQHHRGRFHWMIAPLTNPDGLLQTHATRTNRHGVDLNRNFPTTNWEQESQEYWEKSTRKDPRRFPGSTPLSEAETRWITQEIERFRPDTIVSVHAPYNLLDFDGPPATPPKRLGPLYLSLLGTFPGSLGRYAGIEKKIPVLTIELPSAGTLPSPADSNTIWSDMVQWLSRNLPGGTTTAVTDHGEESTEMVQEAVSIPILPPKARTP